MEEGVRESALVADGEPWSRQLILAGLLAVCMTLLAVACIEVTRETGRIASVWVPNAVAIALLIRRPRDEHPLLLLAVCLGIVTGNSIAGDGFPQAIVLGLCNVVEVAIAVRAMASAMKPHDDFETRAIGQFLLVALLAPILPTAIAALWLSGSGAILYVSFVDWYVPDLLGLLIFTPILLAFHRGLNTPGKPRSIIESILFPLLGASTTVLIFAQSERPLLFTLAPIVLLASFRLRLLPAMITLLAVAATATTFTALGLGPITAAAVDPVERLHVLQAFIATMVMLVLPVLAVLGERDRLSVAVRDGEELFHRIAEATATGILYFDTAGRVTYANARWAELTGSPGNDRGRFELGDWVDPRDIDLANSLWNRSRSLHVPTSADVRYVHPIDGPGWAELSFYPEMEDGLVRGFIARLSDVSRRCEAERALADSEGLYRLLAENSHDVIVRLDLAGRARYVSNAAGALFGVDPREWHGLPLSRFVVAEDVAAFESLFPDSDGDPGRTTAQFRMRRKGADPVWVEASARLLVDPKTGVPFELIASIRDIDLRRRSELVAAEAAAKLREGHRLLSLAETLAHIGHWRFDLATGELDCSPQFSAMIGVSREQALTARELVDRVHPAERRVVLRTLARARTHQGGSESSLRMVGDNGCLHHLRLVAQGDVDANGLLVGVFGIMRDVTEEVKIQAELIRARDAAETAAVAKSNFLATMSHEIRTPMTGVLGMIDLLRRSPSEQDQARYFVALKQSADLLMAVLDDILDFSRIESGKIIFEERDFDIEELLQSTLDLFDGAASQKGLLLAMKRRNVEGRVVRGDPVRLQQIVSNLLNNAIKFTDTGRVDVILSASPGKKIGRNGHPGHRWRIAVRDTGIGIAADQVDQLFEPFVQAQPGTSRLYGGTGLGLAISRRLVEALGGEIGVTSRPGHGATFWVEVDLPDGEEVVAQTDDAPVASTRSLDVLVAEDNPVNQMIISALLRRFGHAVTCVENGRLAVEVACSRRFDCILMDMQMPELDGLAATREIRGSRGANAKTPIIALTADASPERRRFYNHAGLTDFLTKPIDRKALAERLADIAAARPPRTRQSATEQPAAWMSPTGAADLLDIGRYHELRAAIGHAEVDLLLDMLVNELGQRPERIRTLISNGDYAAARAEAHSLYGAATNLGAMALGRIAHTIEGSRDAQPIGEQLDTLDSQARDTILAIASLR